MEAGEHDGSAPVPAGGSHDQAAQLKGEPDMRNCLTLGAALMIALVQPVAAQEVVVTGQRGDFANAPAGYVGIVLPSRPVITLTRPADYVVFGIKVAGDTRDQKQRRADLLATIRDAIGVADKSGVELATGQYLLEPLTPKGLGNLPFNGDGRPDTDQTNFLAKVRVAPGMDLAVARTRVDHFVAAVKPVGRSTISVSHGPMLSMIRPDQYRAQIIDLIAADAAMSAAKFGANYGVDVSGLDRPVEWTRAGPLDVFLYLPAAYVVRRN
jgi:hypothetical protein